MKKPYKTWVYSPRKPPKPKVPEAVKPRVQVDADRLVEELKLRYVQPPPEDAQFNYVVDFSTRWHGSYFYIHAIYVCPYPDALVPGFEAGLARLAYAGSDR